MMRSPETAMAFATLLGSAQLENAAHASQKEVKIVPSVRAQETTPLTEDPSINKSKAQISAKAFKPHLHPGFDLFAMNGNRESLSFGAALALGIPFRFGNAECEIEGKLMGGVNLNPSTKEVRGGTFGIEGSAVCHPDAFGRLKLYGGLQGEMEAIFPRVEDVVLSGGFGPRLEYHVPFSERLKMVLGVGAFLKGSGKHGIEGEGNASIGLRW